MPDFNSMLDDLIETGTLNSESLAWLEIQPQGTSTDTVPLIGVSEKQIRYAEKLRVEFFMRQLQTAEQFGTLNWLCNAIDDAQWWIKLGTVQKSPLVDQWALRVLFIAALAAE